MSKKKKILLLSDDIRAHSGVGTMSKEIVLNTVSEYDWVQLGAMHQHPDHGKILDISTDVQKESGVHDASVRIYASTGYGNAETLREVIELEKPDAILHFTDPRYWLWLYAIEHEIRQQVPIIYYTIWDSDPCPYWNTPYYESCDLLLAISKQTYNIVKQCLKDKDYEDWQIQYVPHGINSNQFYPITAESDNYQEFIDYKQSLLGDKFDFVVFYNSRNLRRKHTSDLILAYKYFCDKLPKEEADRCLLLLHTDPVDDNGTDLPAVISVICPEYKVAFTQQRGISTKELNYLYNLADITANIADNEGFGLGTAESVMAGTPILVNCTGGMQDQCGFKDLNGNYVTEDHFDAEHPTNANKYWTECGNWAKYVFPAVRTLQGSPLTPYIYADIACPKDTADVMLEWYNTDINTRNQYGLEGREYFLSPGSGLSASEMGQRFIGSINTLFDEWMPRERVELVKI